MQYMFGKNPMIYDTCTRTITYNGRVWRECVSADSLPADCHMVEHVGVYQFYEPTDNANSTGFFIMCGEYF